MSSKTRKQQTATDTTEEVIMTADPRVVALGDGIDGVSGVAGGYVVDEFSEADAAEAAISDTGLPRWLPASMHDEYHHVLAVFEQWGLSSDKPYAIDIQHTIPSLLAGFAARSLKPADDGMTILKFTTAWNKLIQWQGVDYFDNAIRVNINPTGSPAEDPHILFRALPSTSYHRTVRGIEAWAIVVVPGTSRVNPKTKREYGYIANLAIDPDGVVDDGDSNWGGVAREFTSVMHAAREARILSDALRTWARLPKSPDDLEVPDRIRTVTFGDDEVVARVRSEEAI